MSEQTNAIPLAKMSDINAEAESPYLWSDVKWVPASSVVPPTIMLMSKNGPCLGLVSVLNCQDDAVRVDVLRALNAASSPAKLLRFIDAARRGEQDNAERADHAAEDERDRLLSLIDGDGIANSGARKWFRSQGAMLPAERAAIRSSKATTL